MIVYSEGLSALLQHFIMDVKDSVKRSCKVSMEDGGSSLMLRFDSCAKDPWHSNSVEAQPCDLLAQATGGQPTRSFPGRARGGRHRVTAGM